MRRATLCIASLGPFLIATQCQALSPEEVFEVGSRSIVVVDVNEGSRQIGIGSGVATQPDEVVTNCHVASKGTQLTVVFRGGRHAARLLAADVDRDLCLLTVPGLGATPVRIAERGAVRPGARVYAIGSPRGLELTISEGLASGLREIDGATFIQSSAPISPGSSGGGLFDSDGRLVGITTLSLRESQNIGFALPAHWISEVRSRTSAPIGPAVKASVAAIESATTFPTDDVDTRAWIRAMSSRVISRFPDEASARNFLALVRYESMRAGLDPHVVLALIDVSSDFRMHHVSTSGARGLMAVAPIWMERIGQPSDNLFQLRTNLRYGCTIFRHYLDKNHGVLNKALDAYNNQSENRPDTFPDAKHQFARKVLTAWKDRWLLSKAAE